MNPKPIRVAVIGAGFSGLVAARELQRENHEVAVFEKNDRIGGTWIYDPTTEIDPLSLDPTREILHSSMYDALRTNLPRHLMGFSDYPLTPREGGDPRTFPGREEVLGFLDGFAAEFDLIKLVRFGSEVVRVEKADAGSSKWAVEWRRITGAAASAVEVFEAVVVCNGHNTHPRIAEFPGRSNWPGKQVHSHNYRVPDPYKDQIVVVIGNGPSAMDISKDILPFAKEVHQSSRNPKTTTRNQESEFKSSGGTVVQHSVIKCAEEDGKLVFEDGSSLYADIILHCTGYSFCFPFLRTNNIVTVDDNRVGPLYKHVFPPSLAPSLSFIGLNNLGVTPLLFELQCKWVARVLSGKLVLPDEQEMMVSVQEHYKQMEEVGLPKHHTHRLQKYDYERWLAEILELQPPGKWREEMFLTLFTLGDKYGENRLDKWDADKWLQEFKQGIN